MSKDDKKDYYVKGIPVPETPMPDVTAEPWQKTKIVGKALPRVDGYDRVSGSAIYASDITMHEMLYGAILRSPHPHAIVKAVDTKEAEKMPGVRAAISGASPEADLLWPYSKDMKTKLFDPRCRYEGEVVAAVAAETPYHAWDALKAIRVDYEVLPYIADEQKSLAAGSPKIHEAGNKVKADTYERGDVKKGFAEADVVLEQKYRTACEIHTPLELHGCVAKWDGDSLTIWESTQGVYSTQARIAEVLKLPLSKVRVISRYMGGGFGSKLQAGKNTIIAAVLAKKTARPVKLFLTREETLLDAGNRPPANMTIKAGVKKDGTLTALEFTGLGTGGAYPAGGTGLLDWLVRDLYTCPNVRSETTDVYINAGPSRPFRAPGHPQGSWALEQMMDSLAEAVSMDPVELRLKNIPTYSQGREGNPPYTTTGLEQCIREGAQVFGWNEARQRAAALPKEGPLRRGVGMASCLWFAGGGNPPSTAIVKFFSDGSVNLNLGMSDIGTGTKTVMAMVVAEELGVQPALIQIENADTGTTQYATPSGGSKTVPTEAPTVRAASLHVKKQLLAMAADDLKTDASGLAFEGDSIISTTDPAKKIKITDVSTLKKRGLVVGVGYRGQNPANKVVNPFAAQFCEVEVNMKTGEVKVLRFIGSHESGRVMNRMGFDSQVYGGITMGIGYAMSEERIFDVSQTGKMVNKNWHDYKIPTALDIPADMVSHAVDLPDPEANLAGAKGLGEPVTIPTAAAVANAVYHATGVRVAETPMNAMRLSRLFSEKRNS
jgi:CO/xanthine dehydrogenase Mo-binding subunit